MEWNKVRWSVFLLKLIFRETEGNWFQNLVLFQKHCEKHFSTMNGTVCWLSFKLRWSQRCCFALRFIPFSGRRTDEREREMECEVMPSCQCDFLKSQHDAVADASNPAHSWTIMCSTHSVRTATGWCRRSCGCKRAPFRWRTGEQQEVETCRNLLSCARFETGRCSFPSQPHFLVVYQASAKKLPRMTEEVCANVDVSHTQVNHMSPCTNVWGLKGASRKWLVACWRDVGRTNRKCSSFAFFSRPITWRFPRI